MSAGENSPKSRASDDSSTDYLGKKRTPCLTILRRADEHQVQASDRIELDADYNSQPLTEAIPNLDKSNELYYL